MALLCFSALHAQEIKWPEHDGYRNGKYWYYIRKGYVVTDARDTVGGLILFSSTASQYAVRDTITQKIWPVNTDRIATIHFLSDSTRGIYTDWINVDHGSDLRILIAQRGPVGIYELARGYGPSLLLVTPKERINMIHTMGVLLHNDNDFDAGLLRFVRERYNSNYTDFTMTGNLYTYIVGKEYERLGIGKADTVRDLESHLVDDLVPYGWLNHVSTVYRGYIVTDRQETLAGLVRISPNLDDYAVRDTVTHAVREVNLKEIDFIRVYSDSSERTYKDWYNIHYKDALWILLAKKNDVAMYEVTQLKPFWPSMVLITPHERIEFGSSLSIVLHGGYQGAIRRFIHERYKVEPPNELGTKEEMAAYIVGKECEKIAAR